MRSLIASFGAWLKSSTLADAPGIVPVTTGNVLNQEWLAPYLVRLPSIPNDIRRSHDG